ncbi:MAG: hypothetical protein ABIR26_05425 [Ramlibacter sp.]
MSDGSALSQIRAAFPKALMIPLAEAAPFISATPSAAAKMAQRGGFDHFAVKKGSLWMAHVGRLAEFIDGPGAERPVTTSFSPPVREPKGRAKGGGSETEKTIRPPPMKRLMAGMLDRIEATRAQLDFEQAVYAHMERRLLDVDPRPLSDPKPRGVL